MFVRLIAVALVALTVWAVAARPSESAGPERGYVVRPGDTLWSIAVASYGGDPRGAVWRIQERNGLDSTVLAPGRRLVLPRG